MKEQSIQKQISDYLEAQGGYVVKVITSNKRGTPDLLACLRGQFYAIEVKTPTGKVSELQKYNLEKAHEAGAVSMVVRSLQELKNFV